MYIDIGTYRSEYRLIWKINAHYGLRIYSQNHFECLKSLFLQILTLCQIIALKFFRYPPVSSWVSANMDFERENFEFIISTAGALVVVTV